MPSTGIDWLRERVSELDSGELARGHDPIIRFVRLMAAWTSTRMAPMHAEQPVALDATAADELTAECRVLEEIASANPDLVRGPLDVRRQQWIGTAEAPVSGVRCQRQLPTSSIDPHWVLPAPADYRQVTARQTTT